LRRFPVRVAGRFGARHRAPPFARPVGIAGRTMRRRDGPASLRRRRKRFRSRMRVLVMLWRLNLCPNVTRFYDIAPLVFRSAFAPRFPVLRFFANCQNQKDPSKLLVFLVLLWILTFAMRTRGSTEANVESAPR